MQEVRFMYQPAFTKGSRGPCNKNKGIKVIHTHQTGYAISWLSQDVLWVVPRSLAGWGVEGCLFLEAAISKPCWFWLRQEQEWNRARIPVVFRSISRIKCGPTEVYAGRFAELCRGESSPPTGQHRNSLRLPKPPVYRTAGFHLSPKQHAVHMFHSRRRHRLESQTVYKAGRKCRPRCSRTLRPRPAFPAKTDVAGMYHPAGHVCLDFCDWPSVFHSEWTFPLPELCDPMAPLQTATEGFVDSRFIAVTTCIRANSSEHD